MKKFEILIILLISVSPLIDMELKLILTVLLIILNIKWIKKLSRNKKLNLFIFIILVLITEISNFFLVKIFYLEGAGLTLYIIFTFLLGCIISQKYTIYSFLKTLEQVVYPLMMISLLGFIMIRYKPELILKLPKYHFYHTIHRTIILQNFLITEGRPLQRNSGIAWEPGVYQIYLNMCLFFIIYYNQKLSKIKFISYTVAIFSTYSSTGVIILILNFIIFFKNNFKKINKKYLAIIGVLLIYFLIPMIDEVISKKIFSGGIGLTGRTSVMKTTFYSVEKNLIFGVGNLRFKEMNIGSHDSYIQIMGRYGFVMVVYIIYLIFKLNNIILTLIILLSLSSQVIWMSPLITPFYFFNFKFLKNTKNRNLKIIKKPKV